MIKITSLLFFLFICFSCNAQYYFHKQWDKRFGGTDDDWLAGFTQTPDKGYILVGSAESDSSGDKTQHRWGTDPHFPDYWIVKIDSLGNKVWDKRLGTINVDNLFALSLTKDSGYILGGMAGGVASGDKTQNGRGGWDYWVVKADATGVKEWDKTFGGGRDDFFFTNALESTRDGGYIIGGTSNSGIGGDKTQDNWDPTFFWWDIWIVKIDSTGSKQWDKRYGGIQDEMLNDIKQTLDGGYILAGWSKSDSSGNKTSHNSDTAYYLNATSNSWVVKIDANGNKQWEKRLGTGEAFSAVATSDSGCLIVLGGGGLTDGIGGYPWLVKLDKEGNKQLERSYQGWVDVNDICQTNDGGYLISGDARRIDSSFGTPNDRTENCLGATNTWVFKLDSLCFKQWDKTIFTTGDDDLGSAIQTYDGCYAIANSSSASSGGYKTLNGWGGSYDYFIVKFCMDTITAINEPSKQAQFSIYPNPFTSDISISIKAPFAGLGAATFTITNLVGQTIYRREETNLAAGYTKMLDLSMLANGVYFVSVGTGEGMVTKKVVKQ